MRNKENNLSSNFGGNEDLFDLSSTAVLEKDDTELDLYPDILLDGSSGNLTIVIHHDYYSSNTEHGKALLKAFIDVLKDEYNKISKIFVVDSGVCLFNPNNALFDCFTELCELDFDIVVCKESIDTFNIELDSFGNIRKLSMHEISLELLSAPYLFNLG